MAREECTKLATCEQCLHIHMYLFIQQSINIVLEIKSISKPIRILLKFK